MQSLSVSSVHTLIFGFKTTVKPLSIVSEGTMKNKWWFRENYSCMKVIYVVMYRDKRKWTVLAGKQCMQEQWIEVSRYLLYFYAKVFLLWNVPELCSRSSSLDGRKPDRRSRTLFPGISVTNPPGRILCHCVNSWTYPFWKITLLLSVKKVSVINVYPLIRKSTSLLLSLAKC
jgi:hypothetical protein